MDSAYRHKSSKREDHSNPTIQPYNPYTTSSRKTKTQIRICKFFRSTNVIVASTVENLERLKPTGIKHLTLLSDKFNLF